MPISLDLPVFSLSVLGLLLGFWLGIVVHEAGHLACAHLGGMPVRLVRIGDGPLLARWRLDETEFELRLVPLHGCVTSFPLLDFHRGTRALFILGGPLASVALLLALVSPGIGFFFDIPLWVGLVTAQIVIIASSIIPSWEVEGKQHTPDIQRLLNLWRKPPVHARPYFEILLSRYGAKPPVRPGGSAFGARVVHHLANAGSRSSASERQRSNMALQRELQRGGLSEGEELLVLDALITRGLLVGDPALREKLQEWSERAFALGGDFPTVRGSRGAALVVLGRYEEGKVLLESVPVGPDVEPFDVLMTKIFLAQALSGLGEREAAWRLLDEASAFSKTHPAEGIEPLFQKAYAALGGDSG